MTNFLSLSSALRHFYGAVAISYGASWQQLPLLPQNIVCQSHKPGDLRSNMPLFSSFICLSAATSSTHEHVKLVNHLPTSYSVILCFTGNFS
jgi:hypothetical protein